LLNVSSLSQTLKLRKDLFSGKLKTLTLICFFHAIFDINPVIFIVMMDKGGIFMNIKNINRKLDEHLHDTLILVENEVAKDLSTQIIFEQISKYCEKYPFIHALETKDTNVTLTVNDIQIYNEYRAFFDQINELEKIEMYYQGFNDAISLLTKIMKS
jgi:hypothetical protein